MEEHSPQVEIAPTIVISNSEGEEHGQENNPGDAPPHSDELTSDAQSEQVVIAAIEAERDIALATISSDVERERIELESERVEAISERNEELELCRTEIAALTAKVQALEILLTPPPLSEVVEAMEEQLEIAAEQNLTPQSTLVPIAEIKTEPSEESADQREEEEIPNRNRRFIAI